LYHRHPTQGLADREAKLDILVNNSGIAWGAPFESFPQEVRLRRRWSPRLPPD
jgi:NAD(P)-dependent dehydrogenase (short-subunit alcohol dehydrogenase family)